MKNWTIRDKYVGTTVINRLGQKMTMIGYPKGHTMDVFVRYEESGHICKYRLRTFLRGNVIDHESAENLLDEEWRDVVGYEGKYMVSNLGRVKNLPHSSLGREQVMIQRQIRNYYSVQLSLNGEAKWHRVHRLVAAAFIPNPQNLPQVNHKDENKLNNCAENLEWCDAKYNVNYGTARERAAEKNSKNRLGVPRVDKYKPVEMMTLDGTFIKRFDSIKQAALETGISNKLISRVCKNPDKITQTHGYKWRFETKPILGNNGGRV